MRIAIVSDIHGNLSAFEAVLSDLREASPDLIFHGGDLADGGSGPVEIVDRIRDLGWPGVVGNTDQMLFQPESLAGFAQQTPQLRNMFDRIEDMASFTCAQLGDERIAWLRTLPLVQEHEEVTLVHASPADPWRAPSPSSSDEELQSIYGTLGSKAIVYGHIHQPYIRQVAGMIVANSGSVGLPYDGDPRASYLLLDDITPTVRRVTYDIEREVGRLLSCGLPHADWSATMLRTGRFEMP